MLEKEWQIQQKDVATVLPQVSRHLLAASFLIRPHVDGLGTLSYSCRGLGRSSLTLKSELLAQQPWPELGGLPIYELSSLSVHAIAGALAA